jgi:hypothetical protein
MAVRQAREAAEFRAGGKPRCDYAEAAAVFERTSSGLRYRRFENVGLALRYVNEELSPRQRLLCTMEVGDARYASEALRDLYLSPLYPISRSAAS